MIIEWYTQIYLPLRVSDEDREKIFWRNAANLLQLDVQGVG